MTDTKKLGPNFKKLMTRKMAAIAIPAGGGFADGVKFFTNPKGMKDAAVEAITWVQAAISRVKQSPDNPYGDDDEAIVGEILRRIEHEERDSIPDHPDR